jgi:hypothetical protein
MLPLVGSFVIAGSAAGFAVHKAVFADAHVVGGLAQAAELVALAVALRQLALSAQKLCRAITGGHSNKGSAEHPAWETCRW